MILTATEIAEAIDARFKGYLITSVRNSKQVVVNLSGYFKFRDDEQFTVDFDDVRFMWEVVIFNIEKDDYERFSIGTEEDICTLLTLQVRVWRKAFNDMLPETLETMIGWK